MQDENLKQGDDPRTERLFLQLFSHFLFLLHFLAELMFIDTHNRQRTKPKHSSSSQEVNCSIPLNALPEGSLLSTTQSNRKQRKEQYQSQVGLCACSPWDTTDLHSSWNCHYSGKCFTAYHGPSEMPRN